MKLQSAWRGAAQRVRYKEALQLTELAKLRASTRIQAAWRGSRVRKQRRVEVKAAIRIQTAWRNR